MPFRASGTALLALYLHSEGQETGRSDRETAVRHLLMNTHIQVLYVNGTIPHLAMLLFCDILSRCYPWEEATFLQEGILGREHQ